MSCRIEMAHFSVVRNMNRDRLRGSLVDHIERVTWRTRTVDGDFVRGIAGGCMSAKFMAVIYERLVFVDIFR